MAMNVAVIKRAKGLLIGGDEGARLVDEAERFMKEEGVCNVEAMSQVFLPSGA